MSDNPPLKPEQLRPYCDPKQFTFKTTDDLQRLETVIGQDRALASVQFLIGIEQTGYNLFALGISGTGKRAVIQEILEKHANGKEKKVFDWCYINNFSDPQKPLLIQLPAGMGPALKKDMEALCEDLQTTLPTILESEEYRKEKFRLEEKLKEQHQKKFEKIRKDAEKEDLTILSTPEGFVVVPTSAGKVLTSEQLEELPKKKRKEKEKKVSAFHNRLASLLSELPQIHKEIREQQRELREEYVMLVAGGMIDELKDKYKKFPKVVEYFEAAKEDVIATGDEFWEEEKTIQGELGLAFTVKPSFIRYEVNAFVTQEKKDEVPIIYEDNPTFANLIGRIDHISQLGALVTDFTLIKAGALAQANGGYLFLDAHKVLAHPESWDALKRTLYAQKITIESIGQRLGLLNTISLEPETIPLDLKIILLGERFIYDLLFNLDPEFRELFKITADFSTDVARKSESDLNYAQFLATMIEREKLKPFDREAVARVIDQSARSVGDAERLSLHMRSVANLLREADYWASQRKSDIVGKEDVQKA
ncbi:MAG: hypothetical protein K940chlam7_01732, partial [Chlamydiae bacterium]|nr:hypothetical protein [Chlamydiota bacterium]